MIVPIATPSDALNKRPRNSRRCSNSVIEPFDARWNCVTRLPSTDTGYPIVPALVVADALDRVGRGIVDRRAVRMPVQLRAAVQRCPAVLRLGLALDVVVRHSLDLGLQDAHRATERACRVRQALRAEQQDKHHDQYRDVPWPQAAHAATPHISGRPHLDRRFILRPAPRPSTGAALRSFCTVRIAESGPN